MKGARLGRSLAAACFSLASISALAGGPLNVCNSAPLKYSGAGTVTLNYDGGGTLGSRTKAQTDAIVTSAVALWTNVGTSTVSLSRGADLQAGGLPVDVTVSNYFNYYAPFPPSDPRYNPTQFTDLLNPVIYDTDGSIVDDMFGVGNSSSVLGFAGSAYYGPPTCRYAEGFAVISGLLFPPHPNNTLITTVFAHEIGHLIGLDHTQLDITQGLSDAPGSSNYPLMYPEAYRDFISLHEDDVAAVSALYPHATIDTAYGRLTGTFTTAGGTPILGANIWAQSAGGMTFSVVSDYLEQGTGYFELRLTPGTYTLHAEAIQSDFDGGSSVGPYSETYPTSPSFQSPLYSGSAPMAPVTHGGGTPTQITISAGCTGTATFMINGTGSIGGNCMPPPVVPTTISPTGAITTTMPTYTWNAVSNAASYFLRVQNNGVNFILTSYTAAAAGCGAGTGTCSVTPGVALANGSSYTWSVNATNAGGTSLYSTPRTITPTVPAVPTTVSPTGTITTTAPAYVWNAVSGAISYTLRVQNSVGATIINTIYTAAAVGCGAGTGTCTITPGTVLTIGSSYNWSVSATNASGTSAYSALRAFTPSLPDVPTMVTPSGTIATVLPTYTWNASAGATIYSLLVRNTSGVAINTSYTASEAGCSAGTGTCAVTPGVALSNGAQYSVFVSAMNGLGPSDWSAVRVITVNAILPAPPAVPTTVAPDGTVATTTPTYSWNASAGATSYFLVVQNRSGVAVSTSFSAGAAGCGGGTGTCSVTPGTALANGTLYYWFVNATNGAGTSAWSAMRAITVGAAGPVVPLAPTFVSPRGSTGTLSPTYTWNALAGATNYTLLVQSAAGVAVNASFSPAAAGCGAGTGTCSVTATTLAAATMYNVFVNASNGAGTGPWSYATLISTP